MIITVLDVLLNEFGIAATLLMLMPLVFIPVCVMVDAAQWISTKEVRKKQIHMDGMKHILRTIGNRSYDNDGG